MSHTPLRRAQLIAPFGVGAMLVNKEGLSLVTAGLDYWYRTDGLGDPSAQKLEEFNVREWRLAAELGVKHFRLPPDFRTKMHDKLAENTHLRIPFLRFPTWHVCPRCGTMEEVEPDYQGTRFCGECSTQSNTRGAPKQIRMNQVPIVAVCEHGHLMDFPFWEWVHRDPLRQQNGTQEKCGGKLKFTTNGSPNLSQQKISCSCDKDMSRSLDRILESKMVTAADGSDEMVSILTANLRGEDNGRYLCSGKRAWFDPLTPAQGCGQQVRGALTSALNAHYADVRSAIYRPRDTTAAVNDRLLAELEEQSVSMHIEDAALSGDVDKAVGRILDVKVYLEEEYGLNTLRKAVEFLIDPPAAPAPNTASDLTPEQAFRRVEQEVLREARTQGELIITPQDTSAYGLLAPYLERVNLVRKLRETRALVGFTRVTTYVPTDLEFRKGLMWREYDPQKHTWLPANVVYGEGIYFELNHERLQAWEKDEVRQYLSPLAAKYDQFAQRYGKPEGKVTPRLVLMHTLAHLLINQLTFDCGYASASLRERLYISEDDAPGLLIYTASGDSEGTLGGLVRMGQPRFFERTFREAVKNARWCSNDPVCMESTEHGGQGPNSMNLAACHSCGLIAETSCEEFNTLLDRALLVGQYMKTDGHQHAELGFFRDLSD